MLLCSVLKSLLLIVSLVCLFVFWDMVSCILEWLKSCYTSKMALNFWSFCFYLLRARVTRVTCIHPSICGIGDQTQDFKYARKSLYQLNHLFSITWGLWSLRENFINSQSQEMCFTFFSFVSVFQKQWIRFSFKHLLLNQFEPILWLASYQLRARIYIICFECNFIPGCSFFFLDSLISPTKI